MLRNSKKRKVKLRKSKKQKVTEEEAPINKLPDAVLVKILSLLPTEEAFRTCVISKKWQTLPTLIYSFNFNCSEYREREDLSFIHNALEHSRSSTIKKFELDLTECMDLCQLDYNLKFDFDFLVNRCCSFAVERNVESLVLGLYSPEACPLPESLYTCSSLITLDVTLCCGFIDDAVISWNSLKSITLGYVVFTDEDMVKLLSGCPSLETMELYRYDGFRRVEINSSKFKTLKLIDYGIPGVKDELDGVSGVRDELEIIAPHLQNLEISGDFLDVKCKLVDVSSVVNAKITYNNKCINHVPNVNEEHNCRDYHQVLYSLIQENLQKLCYATELTIGNWFTQFYRLCSDFICSSVSSFIGSAATSFIPLFQFYRLCSDFENGEGIKNLVNPSNSVDLCSQVMRASSSIPFVEDKENLAPDKVVADIGIAGKARASAKILTYLETRFAAPNPGC
ncbi:hypothetical protein MTR67_013690 [Solanum verrucosum]|uniref:F-box domain-containing protein n=1 Tax=Solanum verrucosum TaxID=315347 RepID=A0AAF0TP17_SOLVR|nr:hypothetical protein MTR67_013690 [Solanum verrucosum]